MAKIPWWRTSFGENEISRIAAAIQHEHISQGTVTAEFERRVGDLLEVPYVVATTSGSMALLMALLAAGIKPGDEVLVPNRTWIATAHAPLLLGAKVRLVDVEAGRPIIDVTQLESRITPKTRAIIPVHLNGRAANMAQVNRIAAARGLTVIEDAAQALGSRNFAGLLGTQSDMGCFSLSVAKIISTGQGGFTVTGNEDLYNKLRLLRTHGVTDFIDTSYTAPGFNFRFTDIQASMGLAQLEKLPARIEKVKAIYAKYEAALREFQWLKLVPVDVQAGEIPIYVEVLSSNRGDLVRWLADRGIETRLFYPDLDQAGYFEDTGDYPNSRVYGREGIFFPSGPDQPLENVDEVIEALHLYEKQPAGEIL